MVTARDTAMVDFQLPFDDNAAPGMPGRVPPKPFSFTKSLEERTNMSLLIPVSWGELLDKITILQIKSERMTDPAKLANVRGELELLEGVRDRQGTGPDGLAGLLADLRTVNERLWEIEDAIRDCERRRDFGERFIELARAVYFTNDRRAELKYRINGLMGSQVIEEKSYTSYADGT